MNEPTLFGWVVLIACTLVLWRVGRDITADLHKIFTEKSKEKFDKMP